MATRKADPATDSPAVEATAPAAPRPPDPPTRETFTYEQARDALVDTVARLESGGESLADSMALYQRGEQLAALCEQYLADARAVVADAQRA